MKKWMAVLILGAVTTGFAPSALAATTAPPAPSIVLDGLPLPFPVPPAIVRDRTMVPFRAIAEALGVTVTWNADTRTIDARGSGADVRLGIDDPRALVNGVPQNLDVPPMIVPESGRTLVPLRFFSEAFGARVNWDGATRTVTIASPPRSMRTLAFYAISSYAEREYVSRFSSAAYGWSVLKADGSVDFAGDSDFHWPEPAGDVTGEKLLADARAAHVKRYLMVYAADARGEYAKLVRDAALSEKAVGEISAAAAVRGFDGVVLDMEYLGQTEQGEELEQLRQGYTRLVQGLSRRLHGQNRELVLALHPPNSEFHGYDYTALGREADFIEVMAHDYVDHSTALLNPEPPALVIQAIEQALEQEVPREKLLLGIVAPYETPETFAQKVGLAKRYSLAGVSVWRLGTVGQDRMSALEESVLSLH